MTGIIAEFGSSIVPHLRRYPTNSTFGEFTAWSGKAKTVRPGFDSYREYILDWWCKTAAKSGATHVKIQCFKAEHFPIAEQESKRPLEFPRELVPLFVETAHRYGLKAGASVFDKEAVELAVRHCDFIKLAAREQYNKELAWAASDFPPWTPSDSPRIKPVYRSVSEWNAWDRFSIPLHKGATLFAIQKYPARLIESLLCVINASRRFTAFFNAPHWGWSSHTRGWIDCLFAAKLGAAVIEKHLALSPSDIEAGHSLLPDEFSKMARAINGSTKGDKHK